MQEREFEAGVWAVVHSVGRKYIGLTKQWSGDTEVVCEALQQGEAVFLDPAFELHTAIIPIQTPNGPALNHVVQVIPVDGATGAAKLWVLPTAIHMFSDMRPDDRARHKKLVMQFLSQIEVARKASDAGIVMAKRMPGEGIRGPS